MATSSTCDSACGKEPVDIAKAKGAPLKKILFFGAGVLGSLYAARLKQSGQDVSMLARNKRLKDIREHGIVLEHALSGKREVVTVPAMPTGLMQSEPIDLCLVSRVPVVRWSAMLCAMWWFLAFSSQQHLGNSMALPLRD